MRIFLFLFSLFALAIPATAQSALTIQFKGLSSRDGQLMVSLRDANGEDIQNVIVPIPASGNIEYTFSDLNNGTYIVATFHDENSNSELDVNFVGIPEEDYGFSNDARGFAGPPSLEDQRFILNGDKRISITLK